jgi:mannonate dehydratase
MRLGLVCNPPTDQHLTWAAQIGVTDYVVLRYSTVDTAEKLAAEVHRAASFGLKLSVIEADLPFVDIIHGGPNRDTQIANVQRFIREMGRQGIEVFCYNFMPETDWTRTSFAVVTRGGALTNEFDLAKMQGHLAPPERRITASRLWDNLTTFLRAVVPVAESAGVKLAMHQDDPPLPELKGAAQIMHSKADFARLFEIAPSPANGICFCTGSFSAGGADIPALIRHFGNRIHFAHFRNLRGTVPKFWEPFQDDGDIDMAAAMRALRDINFRGTIRPDHVPKLDGEPGVGDGYHMLGRLFAVGYLRGLMHALEPR